MLGTQVIQPLLPNYISVQTQTDCLNYGLTILGMHVHCGKCILSVECHASLPLRATQLINSLTKKAHHNGKTIHTDSVVNTTIGRIHVDLI